jgi:hypothetical protein
MSDNGLPLSMRCCQTATPLTRNLTHIRLSPCLATFGATQVWHRSNWHWYLKQEIPFSGLPSSVAGPGPALTAAWDGERPGLLHIVGACGQYVRAALCWQGCVSARGTAAVVDGCDVLITPFRWAS